MFNSQAILADAERILDAIVEDLKDEAVKDAQATAPVVTGAYRDSLEATDEGVYGAADHSIFVELRHNTIANAIEELKSKADSIAAKHRT